MNAEEVLVNAVAARFYEAVPTDWRTYCGVTSRIAVTVLRHFEVPAELTPAQLWYAGPDSNIIVGFVDNPLPPGQWNGHVVCTTPGCLIDTATATLTRDFGIPVPTSVAIRRFKVSSQALGRTGLNERDGMWWFRPPRGFGVTPPEEPRELIDRCAAALIERVATDVGREPLRRAAWAPELSRRRAGQAAAAA